MKKYKKIIDGVVTIKERSKIVVNKDGRQYIGVEKIILEDGWEEVTSKILTEDEIFSILCNELRSSIIGYDSSDEVNQFSINGISMWLDKATRAGLKLRFEAEMAMGKTETTLWFEDKQFPLPLSMAIQLLYAIEVYASACYDNTQRHLAEVEKLSTLEEVRKYDYKVGYPEKLNF